MKSFSIRDTQFVFTDKAVAFKKKNNSHTKFHKRAHDQNIPVFFLYNIIGVYLLLFHNIFISDIYTIMLLDANVQQ